VRKVSWGGPVTLIKIKVRQGLALIIVGKLVKKNSIRY